MALLPLQDSSSFVFKEGITAMTEATKPQFARELATFARKKEELKSQEGKYAVISGDDVLGVFASYTDALECGYNQKGLEPFLVKQISPIDIVANFTRTLEAA